MNKNKTQLLQEAYDFCNEQDKSTEFMLQYMQDTADATLDEVIDFLTDTKMKLKS